MDNSPLVKRPLLVTLSCALLFSFGLIVIVYTFTGVLATYGKFYSAINVLFIIIMFAGLSGVWSMEKWGVWTYLAILVLKFGVDIWIDAFKWWELLLILPLILFFRCFKLMK